MRTCAPSLVLGPLPLAFPRLPLPSKDPEADHLLLEVLVLVPESDRMDSISFDVPNVGVRDILLFMYF